MSAEAVEWDPKFRVAARRKGKSTGQDANDRVRLMVKIHALTHHVAPRAKAMEPSPVASSKPGVTK